jgi:hypothetical protein
MSNLFCQNCNMYRYHYCSSWNDIGSLVVQTSNSSKEYLQKNDSSIFTSFILFYRWIRLLRDKTIMIFMNTSADVSKFKVLPFQFKCRILLKPVLGGVDGSFYFPVLSINRINQTEPTTFSILPFWAFFRYSYFLYSNMLKHLFYSNH